MTFDALGGCSKKPRTDEGREEEEEAVADETTRLVVPIAAATSTRTAATTANNKTEPTSQTSSSTPAEDAAAAADMDAANTPPRRQSIVEPRDIVGLGIDILIFVSVQFVLRTQCKYCTTFSDDHTSSLWCVCYSTSGLL